MRFIFRGLAIAIPLLCFHVACGDSGGGAGTGGIIAPDGSTTNPDGAISTDGGPVADSSMPDADAEPPPPPIVTVTTETLSVEGNARSYVLAVPVTYDAAKRYPLVLSLHGDTQDGATMHQLYPYEVGSQQEAIIAYPSGNNLAWDVYGPAESNADWKFLLALVPALAATYNIDPTRVLGFGYSSGAFMVNQLGCKAEGFLRAIAPNEGGAPADTSAGTSRTCNNTQSLGVFVFHGDADPVIDIGSGNFETKFWSQRNGCSTTQTEAINPAPCIRASSCPAATPVTYCVIPGQGHVVWDQAAAASWSYFKALP